jgi:hypothetical protein
VAAMLERALLVSERFLANNFLDQAILRHALWYTPEVRQYVLPATWQCRGAMDCNELQVIGLFCLYTRSLLPIY